MPAPLGQAHRPHFRMPRRQAFRHGPCPIGRSVIDNHDLERAADVCPQKRRQLRHSAGQLAFLIQDRQCDVQLHAPLPLIQIQTSSAAALSPPLKTTPLVVVDYNPKRFTRSSFSGRLLGFKVLLTQSCSPEAE